MKAFRVHGTTDDVTECGLCGRVELKSTVILVELDADGNDVEAHYYGSDCAPKAAGWTQADFKKRLKAANAERTREKAERDMKLRDARDLAEAKAFAAWAATTHGITTTPKGCVPCNNDVFDALATLNLTDGRGGRRRNFDIYREFIAAVPANERGR